MNTLTNDECRKRHDKSMHKYIYEGTLCAFARKGQGVCNGDSGGPLAVNEQLVGVASWAKDCARGVPDGYVRISMFLKWIREISGVSAV